MAIRNFTDSNGIRWQVWRVQPSSGGDVLYAGPERRKGGSGEPILERRQRKPLTRAAAIPGLEGGWLCFECDREKRRLFPAPDDWETCPEEVLGWYCRKAELVRAREGKTLRAEIPQN